MNVRTPQPLLGLPAVVGVSGARPSPMNAPGTPGLGLVDVVVLSASKHSAQKRSDAIAAFDAPILPDFQFFIFSNSLPPPPPPRAYLRSCLYRRL